MNAPSRPDARSDPGDSTTGRRVRLRGRGAPPSSSPLFTLAVEWQALVDRIEAAGGELVADTEAEFRRLADAIAAKVDAYGALLDTLELQAGGLQDRIAVLQGKLRARVRTGERLRERLVDVMRRMDVRKLEGEEYAARLGESDAVVVEEEGRVPANFWRPVPAILDIAGIKRALKAGQAVPGARLEERTWVAIK